MQANKQTDKNAPPKKNPVVKHGVCTCMDACVFFEPAYLSGQDTEKNEDEQSLKCVEDGKKIRRDDRSLDDMEYSEDPGSTQEKEQGKSTPCTRPNKQQNKQRGELFCSSRLPPNCSTTSPRGALQLHGFSSRLCYCAAV